MIQKYLFLWALINLTKKKKKKEKKVNCLSIWFSSFLFFKNWNSEFQENVSFKIEKSTICADWSESDDRNESLGE